MEQIDVWYLAHSGFAVNAGGYFLIFDYYIDTCDNGSRSLASGVIEPDEISNKNVLIFSSHRHPDHFNPVILSWKDKLPHAEYYLSSDIPKSFGSDWVHFIKPNEVHEVNGLKIRTFKSTDEGVAFLVSVAGVNIYHAGDLNWWH
jgi:L-ascorbate metabolism protein UlaG (beta-lactamase superfamily)